MSFENKQKDPSDSIVDNNSRLRITKRGKAVLALAIAAPILIGGGATAEAIANAPSPKPTLADITVENGDSAWKIAEEINPTADPRETINEIGQYNPDIVNTGYNLTPGEVIKFPVQDIHNDTNK